MVKIYPGHRQKHAGVMLRLIGQLEDQLPYLKKGIAGWQDDETAIPASCLKFMSEAFSALEYSVGQANGPLMFERPDNPPNMGESSTPGRGN